MLRLASRCKLDERAALSQNPAMCAPALCMQSKWTPALSPLYRPPRASGWTILEMPDIFPDTVRDLWHIRKKRQNQNGHDAVIEMAEFAKMNGAEVTKEVVGAIRAQADAEWCAAEPSRCSKRVSIGTASTPRTPTAAEKAVTVRITRVSATPKASPVTRRCCGGRSAR